MVQNGSAPKCRAILPFHEKNPENRPRPRSQELAILGDHSGHEEWSQVLWRANRCRSGAARNRFRESRGAAALRHEGPAARKVKTTRDRHSWESREHHAGENN